MTTHVPRPTLGKNMSLESPSIVQVLHRSGLVVEENSKTYSCFHQYDLEQMVLHWPRDLPLKVLHSKTFANWESRSNVVQWWAVV